MTNRLAGETSPYLLQHAENPVDWYPWGPEALERARQEDRPILVSIGYSACHWCHVMAHESFEDTATARLMNEHFVNIKVDREERPDVDAVYMEAVQALAGQGGWPLNVFLTPDGRPFFGGTYFPPRPGHGMPSWQQVLASVSAAYRTQRGDVLHNAEALTEYVRRAQSMPARPGSLDSSVLKAALDGVRANFDWADAGFGGAPKFPQPLALEFVLRMTLRSNDPQLLAFVRLTLDRMASGGIYDHLGGGFHRYTVDGQWVVPHFEKMLYDNALLALSYIHAFQATGEQRYREVAEGVVEYLLRDMRSEEGAFYSAEDADSEGVEGKYYVWTPDDLRAALDPVAARAAMLRYGVTETGNFEGATILTLALEPEAVATRLDMPVEQALALLDGARRDLFQLRARRVPPGKDTKILAAWNALAIRAMAEVGRTLHRRDVVEAAVTAARFVLERMRPKGWLVRSYRNGPGEVPAFLEDHAFLAEALVSLYEATGEPRWIGEAEALVAEMGARFGSPAGGGLFDAPSDGGDLFVRPRSFFDNPIPSGNAAAAMALLRLQGLTGRSEYGEQAQTILDAARELMVRAPLAAGHMLAALDMYVGPQVQVAIAGDLCADDTRALVETVSRHYLPNAVLAAGDPGAVPLLQDRPPIEGRATAYVCEHFTCQMPTADPVELSTQLQRTAEHNGFGEGP